ncbi:DnaJ-domain-containing protein [Daldinia loculata]|uniref:DnaJ-domain-containing protein n=1 Tax=Daldinia loculata TaxID=103429 RepID=UPI0020C46157|nr:DnaJ-domain-containing protein [Daldinia loculata]KAI1649893.1 DnaJ-domain-containing protein [Daldinia loculata]
MPPFPTFDCYATLEVASTATEQEITAAYRRLALIHHPDKNPNNAEAATATFQKIQLAYEILHDPISRSRYNHHIASRNATTPPRPESQARSNPSDWTDVDDDDDDWIYDDVFLHIFRYYFFGDGARQPNYPGSFDRDNVFSQFQRERREERERVSEETRKQRMAEAARKKAREDDKKSQEEMKAKQKEDERVTEKSDQEMRWKKLNAVTKDEKVEACLHSGFCSKIQQSKKFKCGACHVKRGIIAFECPYCLLHICQQCVSDFAKKRSLASMQDSSKPEVDPKSTVKPEPEPEAEFRPEAESSTQAKGGRHNEGPNAKSKGGKGHKKNGYGKKGRNPSS